ncbi:hypothetical protein D3C73_1043750 [compost metagenome]
MDTVKPRASIAWLTIWPKRPNPTIRAHPSKSWATSTPSIDCSGLGKSHRSASTHKGVSAMEIMTTAVRTAPVCASKMPAVAAAP